MQDDHGNPIPQFETAEYAGVPKTEHCKFCNQPIGDRYYLINNAISCASCAEGVRHAVTERPAAYIRALIFGIGAAVFGLILYASFSILTGWVIGYLSLAVGYMVGKAMMIGSGGIGGRRYQITALLLTYAAVSMAAIPVSLAQYMKENKGTAAHTQQQATERADSQQARQESKPAASMISAVAYLVILGLASPFLELASPIHGIIGLVILLVGIQIAWKTTAGRVAPGISGPYSHSATAQP